MLFKNKINHSSVYFFALSLMMAGLPLSVFLMSISQFILAANWLIEGNVKQKFQKFFKNKAALALSSLFLIHIAGLLYTTDFNYALKDLRIKLPLLVLPLILSTTENLKRKKFNYLLLIFIVSVLAGTFVSTYVFLRNEYVDIRQISVFISHIRFSLMICIAVFILGYFIFKDKNFNLKQKILFVVVFLWLVFFLFIMESITGVVLMLCVSLMLLFTVILNFKNIWLRFASLLLIILIPLLSFMYIFSVIKDFRKINSVDFSKLERYTSHGNPYYHDTLSNQFENGNHVWLYVSWEELQNAWNVRSGIKFDRLDLKKQEIRYTLVRFLTSKGYRKDADGVSKLTDDEVKMVERGLCNVNYSKKISIKPRIEQILWEYENYRNNSNPNGHSVMMRLEYWKASVGIIKDNWLIGVGTGDMNIAFKDYYNKTKSLLEEKSRLRSHNQYLSIFVGLGMIGFLVFIFSLFYPPFVTKKFGDYYYLVFFTVVILSMISEDTIESQAGLSFYAFLNSFFLFGEKSEN